MVKKCKKIISKLGIYGLLFGLAIFGVGFANAKRVMDFWIYDKLDYNEWSVTLVLHPSQPDLQLT